jgi:hypothetical protein
MNGEIMSVNSAISQLMARKDSYYDPVVIDAFVKTLKEDIAAEVEAEAEEQLPAVRKSWKNSRLLNNGSSQNATMARPIVEITWVQLKVGMEIVSVYFESKPYLRNCVADQKIINNIISLRDNTGISPTIKIRIGEK